MIDSLTLIFVGLLVFLAFGSLFGGQDKRLSRVEAKIDLLLKHAGLVYDPYADAPPRVAEALKRGQKIDAIKEYRAATGAGLKEAKEFVEELERRTPAQSAASR